MLDLYPQYAQVLGMGLLWTTLHCSGMCGPIMAGLTAGGGAQRSAAGRAWWSLRRVLAYQSGRAVMYALLGLLAGALGATLEGAVAQLSHTAGLLVAAALLLGGAAQLPAIRSRLAAHLPAGAPSFGAWSGRLLARALRLVRARPGQSPGAWWRMALIGFVMGLLPCMLMFWVLGVAASTAHPVHGAGVMLVLIGLTTPMLALAGVVPHLLSARLRAKGEALVPWGIMLSGLWLGLISAAANGWLPHAHLSFKLAGDPFAIMLW